MKKVKCIHKFRNNHNQITGYRLQDTQGNIKDITPQQLKQAMKANNKIEVTNLTLTSDNRLVDKKQSKNIKEQEQKYVILTRKIIEAVNKPKALKFKSNQNLEMLEQKAKILGYGTMILKDFISIESDTEITIASDKQIQLSDSECNYTQDGRIDYTGLFAHTYFTSINLQNTDSSNVSNMSTMFCDCAATTIDLSSLDTSRVTNMSGMFADCEVQDLDLSTFNTSNVKDMSDMFGGCRNKTIAKQKNFSSVY